MAVGFVLAIPNGLGTIFSIYVFKILQEFGDFQKIGIEKI